MADHALEALLKLRRERQSTLTTDLIHKVHETAAMHQFDLDSSEMIRALERVIDEHIEEEHEADR